MAYVNASETKTSPLSRVGSAFGALATRYRQYRQYRETFDGLSALTDRDLADLGVARSSIKRISLDASRT